MRASPDKIVLIGSAVSAVFIAVMYFVLHVQALDECHERGGLAVRVDGNTICADKNSIKPMG